MKKLIAIYRHWRCKGFYIRTKTSFSSAKIRHPQLNAGSLFKAELIIAGDSMGLVDTEGFNHKLTDARPAKRKERAK